ncbi:tyrosine-type recombinase/integrase [Vibrio breoganii]
MKNRNATYYVRVYFPKHLVDRGCPKELRFSLKTKQRSTALDRSFVVLHCARTLISHASEKTTSEVLIRKIREQVAIVIDNDFALVVNEKPKQNTAKVASKATSSSSKANPTKQQDLLAQFIEFKKLEGVKNKNLGLLHSRVKAFVDSCKTQLDCVTSRDANDFLASLYTQKLSIKTVRDYLAAVKQFYNWLVIMQFVVNNPFNLIKVKTDTRLASEQRKKWSNEELWKLFTHDNFTGEIGNNDTKVNYQRKQQDFWLPYILLYTGARVGEVCQLKTKDVVQMEGVWCVSINEEDDKSVKTKASVRLVPLHKQLLGLGFLNYVNQRYEAKQEQLFDIKSYGVNQSWSEQFSKRFAKVLKQIDLVGKDRPTLHGLRHTFIDAAQSVGIPENEVADIVGHRKPSLTYGRYAKRVPIIRLQKAVNTIQFKINCR